jgi:N-acetylmuramoyl-L-alanine amidase
VTAGNRPLIVIDPGHGGEDPGAEAHRLLEKELTLTIGKRLRGALLRDYEVEADLTRSDDRTISLGARTAFANQRRADYLVSVHINSGGGQGYEDYVHSSTGEDSASERHRSALHRAVIGFMREHGVLDRGEKRANFHMLRESNMPAVLTENLFIDSDADARLLKNDAFLTGVAEAHARGIADALRLARRTGGPFGEGRDAVTTADLNLRASPSTAQPVLEVLPRGTVVHILEGAAAGWRRVQVVLTGGLGYVSTRHLRGAPPPLDMTPDVALLGAPRATRRELEAYLHARPRYRSLGYSDRDARSIVGYYMDTAPRVALDPLLAFAQMILETGAISSDRARRPDCNPAGIGVKTSGQPGVVFGSWLAGVRAQIGRLLAYALPPGAGTTPQQALIDEADRWRPVPASVRGAAPALKGLSGTWATDRNYARKISSVANDVRGETPQ